METSHAEVPETAASGCCTQTACWLRAASIGCGNCFRATDHWRPWLSQCDDDDRGTAAPAAPAEVRREDRAQRRAVDAVLARARRAPQGRAEYPIDHDRRYRLRRL